MRVFIYEYTCAAGAAAHSLSAALQSEGWAMLRALLEDFGGVAEIETLTLLEERFEHNPPDGICRRVRAEDEEFGFRKLAAAADFTLLIAPEFDAILQTRCRWVLESGGRLLGPGLAAVELTGDKLALSRHLRARCVPTPESRLFVPSDEVPNATLSPGVEAAVWGRIASDLSRSQSAGVTELPGPSSARRLARPGPAPTFRARQTREHRLPDRPALLHSFDAGGDGLSDDGRFHYLGGSVPLRPDLSERAVAIAKRAIETVRDLQGYVGVDVVLGQAEDGSGDAVIEINPRPTTSYVGLRALAAGSLAEALLHVTLGIEIPNLEWQSGTVRFDTGGTVQWDA